VDISNAEKILQTMQKFQKISISSKIMGEMPRSEIKMLKLIKLHTTEASGVTISTLSEHLAISKPAVSQMINVLEDRGYVERITTKNDRRIVYVKLTDAGEHSLERALQAVMKVLNEIFGKMGEEDTKTLLALLDKLCLITSDFINK
jgi:DNA-binding MarR family transcriptional regulator